MAAPRERAPIIETRQLGHRFAAHKVLDNINLRIEAGEIFGVLGPDGAGKTTLMQIMAAILDPVEGHCQVLGYDTVKQSSAVTGRIGYMPQGFSLYDQLTVDENLAFAARIRGIGGETWRLRRERLLAMAGLTGFGQRRAAKLSGGMRKKLSLCTNLIHQPALLLLDELSLGVDPVSRRDLWDILYEFREGGSTIVVTTPYMDEATYCDRIALLNEGRVLADDTPRNLIKAMGGSPESSPTLEEVFLHLTATTDTSPTAPIKPPALEQTSSAKEAVIAESVTCRFGDFTAVDRVSMVVNSGEVLGFVGPNGAGKTTLIRAMCGLLKPSSGSLRVAGIDVVQHPLRLRQRIGYMSQRFSLYPDLTVIENLRFFAGVYGLKASRRQQAIAWAVDMTGLDGMEASLTARLSGALRQRLALACSVLHQPLILFLDEPTSGVDPASRRRFWRLIRDMADTGMTVFVTTHYLEEADYCDRLGLMYQGRLIALGSVAQLRSELGLQEETATEAIFMAYIQQQRSQTAPPAAASQ